MTSQMKLAPQSPRHRAIINSMFSSLEGWFKSEVQKHTLPSDTGEDVVIAIGFAIVGMAIEQLGKVGVDKERVIDAIREHEKRSASRIWTP